MQVCANAREAGHDIDPEVAQLLARSDAGKHEQLGCADHARAEDDFTVGEGCADVCTDRVLDAAADGLLNDQSLDLGVRDDGEVRPARDWGQVGVGRALPRCVDDVGVVPRCAFSVRAVAVLVTRVTRPYSGLEAGFPQRVRRGRRRNDHRPIKASIRRIASDGSLAALEVRKERVVVPARGPGGLPRVVARPVAANVHHAVDPAGSAQHLAARPPVNGLVSGALRNRFVVPVNRRAPEPGPSHRV